MSREPLEYQGGTRAPFPHRMVAIVMLLAGFAVIFIGAGMYRGGSDLPEWVLRVVVNAGGLLFAGGMIWLYLTREKHDA